MEEEPWQRLLRDALAVLALPSDEQVRITGPFCIACDLLNEFDHARVVALNNAPTLSEKQRELLGRIEGVICGMQEADFECFNNEVVRRPAWQELRELATDALQAFGWGPVVVRPCVEVEPGIWHRPYVEPGAADT